MSKPSTHIKAYAMLHISMLLYALSTVCMKMASSNNTAFSINFFAYYALAIFLLFVYAIIWQMVLKHIPLNKAYSAKTMVVIYGFIFGASFFGEKIDIRLVLGAIIMLCGMFLVIHDD